MAQPETRLAALVLHNADLALSVRSRSAEQSVQHVFSHTVKRECTPESDAAPVLIPSPQSRARP
jgi:hypothetical protein